MAIDIVISHVAEDDALCGELERHLAGLGKSGAVRVWSERDQRAGEEPAAVRVARLEAAQVVLVLMSAGYVASERLEEVRAHAGRALVIPVAARPCTWTGTFVERLAPLPPDGKPVASWPDRDAGWEVVVVGLRAVIAEVGKTEPEEAPPSVPAIHGGVATVFVGREEELAELRAALLGGGSKPVMIGALQGMAGVGKSYLADRFAFEHRADFPGGYVKVSLDPATAATVGGIEDEIARKMKCARQAVRAELVGRRALLHIENVDDEDKAAVVAQVATRLSGCAVVISGRSQRIGRAAGWKRIEVHELSERLSLELLAKEIGAAGSKTEEEDRKRLAVRLGHLPLALHLAAGYVLEGGSVDGFLKELGKKKLAVGPVDLGDPMYVREGARAILSETFDLSLRSLKKAHGADADKIFALGHAVPSGVGRSLGAAIVGLDEEAFEELMVAARRLSIVEQVRDPSAPAWKVHPLLAELLRTRSDAEWMERMTEWFVERLPERKNSRWNEVHAESEALVAWLAAVPIEEGARVERAGSLYATDVGPFPAWKGFCERALPATGNLRDRSNVLWTLCQVARHAADLVRAEEAAEQKALVDRALGDAREEALALGALADVHISRRDYDEALHILRDLLPIYERRGGRRDWAIVMGRIADIHQTLGRLGEALSIRREYELPVFEHLGDTRERAVTLGKIADVYRARGELEEALRIYRGEQLPVYEQLGDMRATAITMDRIAKVHEAQGNLDDALLVWEKDVLPVHELLGERAALVAVRTEIGRVYLARGRSEDIPRAQALLHQAIADADGAPLPYVVLARALLRKHHLD